MTSADVHPLWLSRAPTVMSMQQLEDDYGESKSVQPAQPLQCAPRPDAPVADALGAALPCYAFPAMECKIHPPQKRVRSFGDLNNALVPDLDEVSDDLGCVSAALAALLWSLARAQSCCSMTAG